MNIVNNTNLKSMKHKKKEHFIDPTMQQENKSDHSTSPSCQFCDNKFTLLRELMEHKKIQHEEKINICWNYPSGNCEFGSDNCWFLHEE